MDKKRLNDAEVMALSALIYQNAILMDGENAQRIQNGYAAAWTIEGHPSDEESALRYELSMRGILPAEVSNAR